MASSHVALVSADGTTNRRIASSLYGYCQTGSSTAAKTVSLYTGNGTTTDGSWSAGDLFHGLTITVRFRYTNTATNPTLNVNSTGAKRIYKYGTTSPGDTASTSWQANSVISLTYDTLLNSSGCWVMNDHLDDTTSTTQIQADWGQTDPTASDYIKNKPTIFAIASYTGNSGSISVSNGVVTQIVLTTSRTSFMDADYFELFDGGIRIKKYGCYRITGSIDVSRPSNVSSNQINVFIRRASDANPANNTWSNANTNVAEGKIPLPSGVSHEIPVMTTTIVDSVNDCDAFYLAVRMYGGSGTSTVYTGHRMTYLTVEWLGDNSIY